MPSTLSYCWIYFSCYMLVCVVLIIWRGTIFIKICSVFSFLISLVADPSYPLYLIVSCGKFLVFRVCFSFPLVSFFFLIRIKLFKDYPKLKSADPNHCFALAHIS